MGLPSLRCVDAVPIEHDGDTYVVLHDPEGYVECELMLSAPAFFIAAHLDGSNDVRDIQAAFARQYGILAQEQEIRSVVEHLDHAGYLMSGPFLNIKTRVDEGFLGSSERPAYLAGRSYPTGSEELRTFIDDCFTRVGGPGRVPGAVPGDGACLPCIIAPHIDFTRGGHTYAHAYLRMYQSGVPETVLLFGVAHCAVPAPFVLTRKHFATPFGTLTTDQALVDRLTDAADWDPFAFETIHRTEHSLEFQAVMLAYLYGPRVTIVPVLCSSFSNDGDSHGTESMDSVVRFLAECRAIVHERADTTAVVAGADLAHVGARFGDAFDIDDAVVKQVAARDREDLAYAGALQPEAFYRSVMRDHNARRVCGLNCIYAALKSIEEIAVSGEIIHYDYAHDPNGGIVSFAAGAFGRK